MSLHLNRLEFALLYTKVVSIRNGAEALLLVLFFLGNTTIANSSIVYFIHKGSVCWGSSAELLV